MAYKEFILIEDNVEKFILPYVQDDYQEIWMQAMNVAMYFQCRLPKRHLNNIEDENAIKKFCQLKISKVDDELPTTKIFDLNELFINKNGLRILMNRSNCNKAAEFHHWIRSTIFPTIRNIKYSIDTFEKTGLMAFVNLIKMNSEKIIELEHDNEKLKRKMFDLEMDVAYLKRRKLSNTEM